MAWEEASFTSFMSPCSAPSPGEAHNPVWTPGPRPQPALPPAGRESPARPFLDPTLLLLSVRAAWTPSIPWALQACALLLLTSHHPAPRAPVLLFSILVTGISHICSILDSKRHPWILRSLGRCCVKHTKPLEAERFPSPSASVEREGQIDGWLIGDGG